MPNFKELAGSPVEIYDAGGLRAQRRLLCAYEDKDALLAVLLGEELPDAPAEAASYPGHPEATVARVRIEPFEKRPDDQGGFDDVTAQINSYSGQFVVALVDYELSEDAAGRPSLPTPPRGTQISYRIALAAETIELGGLGLHWQTDPTLPIPPGAAPVLRVPMAEHHIAWNRVARPPWQAIRDCTGCVNATAFLGAAPETLLFDGAKADRRYSIRRDGARAGLWRLSYVFRERRVRAFDTDETVGWNHALRDLPWPQLAFDRLVDDNGHGLYRQAEFAALFVQG